MDTHQGRPLKLEPPPVEPRPRANRLRGSYARRSLHHAPKRRRTPLAAAACYDWPGHGGSSGNRTVAASWQAPAEAEQSCAAFARPNSARSHRAWCATRGCPVAARWVHCPRALCMKTGQRQGHARGEWGEQRPSMVRRAVMVCSARLPRARAGAKCTSYLARVGRRR